MYEHVRGILKHNISLNLIKRKHTYLFSNLLNSRNTQGYSNLLNSEILKDKILNSVKLNNKVLDTMKHISTQDTQLEGTQLMILNLKDSTNDNQG